MILEKDFEEFVKLLNKHEVEYMVVGGYALAFHGKPRSTGDLDIWIHISNKNSEKMIRVVTEFGLSFMGFTKEDFLKHGYITQIGIVKNLFRPESGHGCSPTLVKIRRRHKSLNPAIFLQTFVIQQPE